MRLAFFVSTALILTAGLSVRAQITVAGIETTPVSVDRTLDLNVPKVSNKSQKAGGPEEDLSVESKGVKFGLASFRTTKTGYGARVKIPFSWQPAKKSPETDDRLPVAASQPDSKFNWSSAIKQSAIFLGVQHGYAMSQPKTRQALKGPFFKDYFQSVKSLHGWDDGGKFFTNYIAHPLEGSFVGFIQVQNDPSGRGLPLSNTKAYWISRTKAFAWSAAWSTQFEIGPISQASIGNVGLKGKQTYVDLVITPTVGIVLLVAEDALDKYLVRRIERFSGNYYIKIFTRMIFNPTRTMANIIRLRTPWHRDHGLR